LAHRRAVQSPQPPTPAQPPTLLLFGPVTLTGAAGEPPNHARDACLETLAWLLENPGAPCGGVDRSLYVTSATRRSNLSRLRGWLGPAPDGTPFLPHAYSGRLNLHPAVTSDWHALQLLTSLGVRDTPTDLLSTALHLVRGAPLGGDTGRTWGWAEGLRAAMATAARDVAIALTERALDDGDLDLARWAGARGHAAVGDDEELLCLRLAVERRAGNHMEVARLAGCAHRQAYSLGVDLRPSTVSLLREATAAPLRLRLRSQASLW
jgi:hypothetical protein